MIDEKQRTTARAVVDAHEAWEAARCSGDLEQQARAAGAARDAGEARQVAVRDWITDARS